MKAKRGRPVLTLALVMGLSFTAFHSAAQEKQQPEANIAIVNGSAITQGDFDREMIVVKQRLASMGKPVSDDQQQVLRKEVLESLINRELLYQESRNSGIKVEETAVNEQLSVLKNEFPGEDEFKKTLLNMNLSEDFLASQIRRDLAIKKFVDKQIAEKITVSDKEAKSYYDTHPDSFHEPGRVKASHILIKVDSQADETAKGAARKKIEEIQQKVEKGEDFAALAKEFSQCPSSGSGGDLGYFRRGEMVEPFTDAAFALAPGEISPIVETRFGYHLIKSTDKKPETSFAYKDIKEKLQQYLKQNKVQEQLIVYVKELKTKAKVERFMTGNP